MRGIRFILASMASVALLSTGALAASPQTRDIDVKVALQPCGDALIEENWDIYTTEGTEWYLTRYNLGAMDILDFSVVDESALLYDNIGRWDVNRSMEQKAGKCGMVRTRGGYELCWGQGFHGNHLFRANYRMTNAVQGMDDYDCLHIQFVSQGIRPRPRHASVEISIPGVALDSSNCAIWAFGFSGSIEFQEGRIVATTMEPFHSDEESVIILARFDKGLIQPVYFAGGAFEDKLSKAFEGSSYRKNIDDKEVEKKVIAFMLLLLTGSVFIVIAAVKAERTRNMNMFGVQKLKEIGYEREIPFNGNLFESLHVLKKVNLLRDQSRIASAIILRMIYKGQILATTDSRGKVELSFNENADLSALLPSEKELYDMMREASGSDNILQDKEFSRWSSRHAKRVSKWCEGLDAEGRASLHRDGYTLGSSFSTEGQMHARRVVGLRSFLKDFTLIDERSVPEVVLWQEYLVYASLLGIADKVARQLKDINPKQFEEVIGYEPLVMHRVLLMSNSMGSSITNAAYSVQTGGSISGHGGFSSFGGGGGFSGGGFGGGAR